MVISMDILSFKRLESVHWNGVLAHILFIACYLNKIWDRPVYDL